MSSKLKRERTNEKESKEKAKKTRSSKSNPLPVMLCPLCDDCGTNTDQEGCYLRCIVQDPRFLKIMAESLQSLLPPKEKISSAFYSVAIAFTPPEHVGRLVFIPPCVVTYVKTELNSESIRQYLVRPLDFTKNPIFYPTLESCLKPLSNDLDSNCCSTPSSSDPNSE